MKAYLCLADGRIFPGESIGLAGETAGEVIFHTGMTGYQEILTDPNSAGQIITFTYPLIGNYGVNKEDELGKEVLARGIVIKEACSKPSNCLLYTSCPSHSSPVGYVHHQRKARRI